MSAAITVGGVDVLTGHFSEWAYPKFGTLVGILSDGSSIDNEVLQSAAVPRRQATLSGWIDDASDLATLDGYAASKQLVTVNDPDGESRDAVLLDINHDRILPGLWACSLTLVDFGPAGS